MILHIELPQNFVAEEMARQRDIPCLCRVATDFELLFQEPLPVAAGLVTGWDSNLLNDRAMAGAGGEHTHYSFAMVTLEKMTQNVFKIMDLSFFNRSVGWCPILMNGEYGPPGDFWDEE